MASSNIREINDHFCTSVFTLTMGEDNSTYTTTAGLAQSTARKPDWADLIAALGRPEEWTADEHTLTHKGGLALWIANGWLSLDIYAGCGEMRAFSLGERWRLWPKVKRCRRMATMRQVSASLAASKEAP